MARIILFGAGRSYTGGWDLPPPPHPLLSRVSSDIVFDWRGDSGSVLIGPFKYLNNNVKLTAFRSILGLESKLFPSLWMGFLIASFEWASARVGVIHSILRLMICVRKRITRWLEGTHPLQRLNFV